MNLNISTNFLVPSIVFVNKQYLGIKNDNFSYSVTKVDYRLGSKLIVSLILTI